MAVVAQLSNLAPGPLSFGCMIKIIDTKSVCRVGNVGRCELRLTLILFPLQIFKAYVKHS